MPVKQHLVKSSLIACCALAATHVEAQSGLPASNGVAPAVTKSAAKPVTRAASRNSVESAKTRTADAGSRTTAAAPVTASFTASGSVIVLADGIVANATMMQIQAPADGFAYEP
jgi:hypothetical protein